MKHNKLKEADQLADLLKPELMDVPSAEFSDKLLHASMTSYRLSYDTKYRKEERLGKVIIVLLIFFNLMMLYLLKPLAINLTINPVWLLVSVPFLIGLGVLARMNMQVAQAMTEL